MYERFRNPEPPRFSAIGGARDRVFESLRRTPLGLRAKVRLETLFTGAIMTKKLEIAVSDELIVDGRGDTQDLTTKIVVTICDNAAIKDRMSGWSQAEILNVVGVHETRHIVEGNKDLFADDCGCRFCSCHQPHFDQEATTRFQFSLIDPASAPKSGWLQRYLDFFATVSALARESDYAAMCDEMMAAAPVSWKKRSKEIAKYEKSHPVEPDKADRDKAAERTLNLYRKAVQGMIDDAGTFAALGLASDPAPYKQVLAKADEHMADTTFKLIP